MPPLPPPRPASSPSASPGLLRMSGVRTACCGSPRWRKRTTTSVSRPAWPTTATACRSPAACRSAIPALRFEAWFDCEGTWPDFTVTLHDLGAEICQAWFEIAHLASLVTDPAEPLSHSAVAFYQQTPERDLAASSHLGDCLDLFVHGPDAVAGWRRSDDDPNSTVYLLPDADEAGHLVLVLVLDLNEPAATLLHSVKPVRRLPVGRDPVARPSTRPAARACRRDRPPGAGYLRPPGAVSAVAGGAHLGSRRR